MENLSLENAQFTIKEDTPTKLILETNPAEPKTIYQKSFPLVLSIVIAAMLSGLIAINFMKSMKQGLIVLLFPILFFAILLILNYVANQSLAVYANNKVYGYKTITTIDAENHKITKTETNKRVALLQAEYDFEQVKQIVIFCVDQSPMPEHRWASVVAFSLGDHDHMVVNSGPYAAMNALADKLETLTNIPKEKKLVGSIAELPE